MSTVCTYRSNMLHVTPSVPNVMRASSGLTVVRVNNNGTTVGVLTHSDRRCCGVCLTAVVRDYFGVTNVGMRFDNTCNN